MEKLQKSPSRKWLFMVCLTGILVQGQSTRGAGTKVLLVSMDGFRYDYLSRTDTPRFDEMLQAGVSVPYVNNSFITSTFPSHYTMATGLFTESHGIVSNSMYDPVMDKMFTKGSREPQWWEGGEPIWITATNAGLKAGVFFWPGSEVEIRGVRPAMWKNYDESVPYDQRVRTVVSWLAQDDFDLGVMYFDEPDKTGHRVGPDDPQILSVVRRMDGILGLIVSELQKAGLEDKVNLIVTSDHGMSRIDLSNKVIDPTKHADRSLLMSMIGDGATTMLRPQPGKAADLVKALSNIDHLHVMLKEDIPERFHLKNNHRVMDVFAYADDGWTITKNAFWLRLLGDRGNHGYDNQLQIMKPIFLAKGPAFKQNTTVDPIQNVDIYPLVCHLLGIEPSPNNGSLERVMTLLTNQGKSLNGTLSPTSSAGDSATSPDHQHTDTTPGNDTISRPGHGDTTPDQGPATDNDTISRPELQKSPDPNAQTRIASNVILVFFLLITVSAFHYC